MRNPITQAQLKNILSYYPESGSFFWKVSRGKGVSGKKAGWLNRSNGYIQIQIFGKPYYAHRLAFLYMEGYFPENEVDHIDRDRQNNRWPNLREVSRRCNARNVGKYQTNKSGVTGVFWSKECKKWCAQIRRPKKTIHLGVFDDLVSAAEARLKAEIDCGYQDCASKSSAYLFLKERGVEVQP
jgi:hypothetical protein